MKKLILGFLLSGLPAFAQGSAWAASNSFSTTAAAEINQKIAYQYAAGAPSSLNCTVGHDLYINTTNFDAYACSVTGTPGTWVKVGSVMLAGTTTGIGLVSSGSGLTINCTQGSVSQFGCVKPDGSTVTSIGGVLSAAAPSGVSTITIANAGTTGTTTGTLTCLTGAPSTAIICTAGATGGVIGVCTAGCGTTSNATIQINGTVALAIDNATTANDYLTISSGTNGNAHDSGASYPGGTQAIGRVLSTHGGAGSYTINLFPPEIQAATGATVSSFTGDGALITNSGATGAVTATLGTAAAHKYWGNPTGSTTAPAYSTLVAGDIPAALSSTTSVNGTTIPTTTTGSGAMVLATSPSLTTPSLGTPTAINLTNATGFPGSLGIADTTVVVSGGTQGANSCSSDTTQTMTGITTSMALLPGYSARAASLTGWGSSSGMNFYAYPSSTNTLSWYVCNLTGTSITYSSITFNVGVK